MEYTPEALPALPTIFQGHGEATSQAHQAEQLEQPKPFLFLTYPMANTIKAPGDAYVLTQETVTWHFTGKREFTNVIKNLKVRDFPGLP